MMAIETVTNTVGTYNDSVKQTVRPTVKSKAVEITPVNADGSVKSLKNEEDVSEVQANQKHIENAISQANNKMKQSRTHCEFSYHEGTNTVSIKIMDDTTNEVIKEIPPEETLQMIEKMWELAGLLIDERR